MTAAFVPQIALYRTWLAEQRGLTFASYEDMRQWSVRDLDGFWRSIWDYYDLQSPTPFAAVITERKMPGAVWFPGAQVNYARQVFRHVDAADAAGLPAIVSCGEDGRLCETSWPELRRKAAALALHLKEKGIKPGDRIAAYLPNIPETIIAFLASASIGAIWSVCAPDMAAPAVIDRFKQIEPKVLIACGRGPVWRHGDWLKVDPDGSCIIYGRSDATINRHGLRMGTSELYSAIEALPEVLDSLVVDLEYLGRDSYMPLFVVLRDGVAFDGAMQAKINKAVEAGLSRRFLPNEIFAVAEIPRTLSGKKQELPIKKLLLGHPVEKVINREAMANPACLDWYLAFARDYLARTGT